MFGLCSFRSRKRSFARWLLLMFLPWWRHWKIKPVSEGLDKETSNSSLALDWLGMITGGLFFGVDMVTLPDLPSACVAWRTALIFVRLTVLKWRFLLRAIISAGVPDPNITAFSSGSFLFMRVWTLSLCWRRYSFVRVGAGRGVGGPLATKL